MRAAQTGRSNDRNPTAIIVSQKTLEPSTNDSSLVAERLCRQLEPARKVAWGPDQKTAGKFQAVTRKAKTSGANHITSR